MTSVYLCLEIEFADEDVLALIAQIVLRSLVHLGLFLVLLYRHRGMLAAVWPLGMV